MSVSLKATRLIVLTRCSQASRRIVQPFLGSTYAREYSSVWHRQSMLPSSSPFLSYLESRQLLTSSKLSFSSTCSNKVSSVHENKQDTLITGKKATEFDKLFRSITINCRGHDKAVLASYSKFVTSAAGHLDIVVDKVETPRYHIKRYDTLKSAFVHKKHRVQYEFRTYFLIITFLRLTSSTADTFLEYIERNLPEGVAMIVTKEELQPLPKFVQGSDKVAPQAS